MAKTADQIEQNALRPSTMANLGKQEKLGGWDIYAYIKISYIKNQISDIINHYISYIIYHIT